MMEYSFPVRYQSQEAKELATSILHCCNRCTLEAVSSSDTVFGWDKGLASLGGVCVLQSAMSNASTHPLMS